MKKRLLALSAMMLCIVMLLSSCSLFNSTIKFKNLIEKDAEPEATPLLTQAKKLSYPGTTDGYSYANSNSYVTFVDTDSSTGYKTFSVYNIETDTLVWSGTETKNVKYSISTKSTYIGEETVSILIVYKETTSNGSDTRYDLTVLTANGRTLFDLSDVNRTAISDSMWMQADLLCVNNEVYRISEDGNFNFAFNWSDLRKTPSYLQKAGDYYVSANDDIISIYDDQLELVTTYTVPVYDDESDSSVYALANGNVFVQYYVLQDQMAEKYTVLVEGEKYNVYSVLIEAKTGKTKELKLDDYVIEYVVPGDQIAEYVGCSDKIDNIAIAYPIEDQRVNMSVEAAKILVLNNNGKVAGTFEPPVPGATGGFELVAKNRWEFYTVDDRSFLVDEKGDIIGETTNGSYYFDDGLIANKKIYDWDLNMKMDLAQQDATTIQTMNDSVIFYTQEDEVKLYVDGQIKTLISENDAESGKRTFTKLSGALFMITDNSGSKTKYEIYNSQGTLLTTLTDVYSPSVVRTAQNGAVLISASKTDYSGTVYYRVG